MVKDRLTIQVEREEINRTDKTELILLLANQGYDVTLISGCTTGKEKD